MFKVLEDSADRFELLFDNHNRPLVFRPAASTKEYIDLGMGGESCAIAISIAFRRSPDSEMNDYLFVFECIAGDKLFPGSHAEGDVLEYDQADFNPGDGLLSGFQSTKLAVTVGPTRENPFQARLVLSNPA